ncbi:MAG: cobalamin biosynthesis protein CobQ [Candidatus Atribacteria bacterium]|nr:cobalamin biosynthesis protein CobQ [Candidatus Atribacteria bacterium]MBE3091786.1 cobalamin biosynthesis protein CobQ [Candidatus Atribacteria bacterium]MBE3093231.1 cobalamin biosynthesis protein CobQ [Chloroflexota bacterium]MBE3126745.1 cobalamin biosynthesis protein CobQ [Candidatus Atribacteria bacterium]
MSKRIKIFVGSFGSGKTEIAINYSIYCRKSYAKVAIVDLDIVNPYFRTREAKDTLNFKDIKVIAPEGEMAYADLPLISPEIKGLIQNPDYCLILDVGGDDAGAVVLGNFSYFIKDLDYEMLLVVNSYRPFTQSVPQIKQMAQEIENTSRLKINGIVSNPNLSSQTDEKIIKQGDIVIRQVAQEMKLPIKFLCIDERFSQKLKTENFKEPVFYIKRFMKLPWE